MFPGCAGHVGERRGRDGREVFSSTDRTILVLWGGTALGTAAGGVSAAIQVLGEKPLGPLVDDGLLRTNGLSHVGLGGPSDQQ